MDRAEAQAILSRDGWLSRQPEAFRAELLGHWARIGYRSVPVTDFAALERFIRDRG